MAPPITPSSPSPVQPPSIALYISDGLIFELYNGRRPTPQILNQLGKGSRPSQLKRDGRVHSRRRSASTRELPIPLRSNVHGVFMSLRIRFRFDGKCSLHPRYNPETDGRPQHKNCPRCESLEVISMYTRIARKKAETGEGSTARRPAQRDEEVAPPPRYIPNHSLLVLPASPRTLFSFFLPNNSAGDSERVRSLDGKLFDYSCLKAYGTSEADSRYDISYPLIARVYDSQQRHTRCRHRRHPECGRKCQRVLSKQLTVP